MLESIDGWQSFGSGNTAGREQAVTTFIAATAAKSFICQNFMITVFWPSNESQFFLYCQEELHRDNLFS